MTTFIYTYYKIESCALLFLDRYMKSIFSLLALIVSFDISAMLDHNKASEKKQLKKTSMRTFFGTTTKNRAKSSALREVYTNHQGDYLHHAWYLSQEFPHKTWVWSVDFDSTGTLLAVGASHTPWIHNLSNQQESFAVLHESKNVSDTRFSSGGDYKDVRFSPCGNYLAAIESNAVNVVTLEGKKVIRSPFYSYTRTLNAASFDPTGKYLVTGIDEVCLMDLSCTSSTIEERQQKDLYIDCKGPINSLSFDSYGKHLATGAKTIARIFDVDLLQQIAKFPHRETVQSVTFSPCGTYLATGSGSYFGNSTSKGKACLFDWKENKEFCVFEYKSAVTSVAFHPSGNFLAIGIHDGTVRIVNIHTQRQIKLFAYKYDSQNRELCISVSFDPMGEKLAVGLLRIQKALVYKKISHCSLQQLMLFKILSLWFQVKNQSVALKKIELLVQKQKNNTIKKDINTYIFHCITKEIAQQFNIHRNELKRTWSTLPSYIQSFIAKHINNLITIHRKAKSNYRQR